MKGMGHLPVSFDLQNPWLSVSSFVDMITVLQLFASTNEKAAASHQKQANRCLDGVAQIKSGRHTDPFLWFPRSESHIHFQ